MSSVESPGLALTSASCLPQLSGSSGRSLKITQFHFTAWPDHGVPEYATPILAFHKRIKAHHNPSRGPLMVHCRYGEGGLILVWWAWLCHVLGAINTSANVIACRQRPLAACTCTYTS